MQQAIEQRRDGSGVAEELAPVLRGPVGRVWLDLEVT